MITIHLKNTNPTKESQPSTFNLYSESMNKKLFFINTIEDLRDKIKSNDRYELIRAAGLLRQLLIDGYIKKINEYYNLKIEYHIYSKDATPELTLEIKPEPKEFATTLKRLVPNNNVNLDSISLDKFLKTNCIFVKKGNFELDISIFDVIDLLANSHGGVHIDNLSRRQKFKNYIEYFNDRDFLNPINIQKGSYLLRSIKEIGEITINASTPLILLIQKDLSTQNGIIGAETYPMKTTAIEPKKSDSNIK